MILDDRTCFVTGATGFVGGALVRRLVESGASVRALYRSPGKTAYIRNLPRVELVQGDITDPALMEQYATDCDYVFHVAALTGGSMLDCRRVNVYGTRSVARAAALAGVTRLVHVSTIATYGYRDNHAVITEDSPRSGSNDPYVLSKREAESALRDVATQYDLSYTIQRPGMIYGPRSGMWTRVIYRLARRNPTLWLGDGSGTCYPIHIDDVTDMLLLMATHPDAHGQAFNCTPDPSPTWQDFIGHYHKLAGHDRWLHIPARPVEVIATTLAAFIFKYTFTSDPAWLDYLLYIRKRRTYSTLKARDLLDWQPEVPLDEGIAGCAAWLREEGLLR